MPLGGRLYAHPGPQSVVPPCDSADPGGGATHKRGGAWPPSDEARAAGPQDEVGDRTSQRTTIRQHNTLYPSILVAFETGVEFEWSAATTKAVVAWARNSSLSGVT